MPPFTPRPYHNPPILTDEEIARGTLFRLTNHLRDNTVGLSTANKNRVLLALHAQIAEQLDALATHNET